MRFLLNCLLIFCFLSSGAQTLWINKGTDVLFSQGLQVSIGGNLLNDSGSVLQSSATLYVNGSLENKGTFNHNGELHLQNDWIQSGIFADEAPGVVSLEGDLQLLTGDSASDFNRLICLGTGIKRQTRNISTGVLELNDRQLDTDSFRLLVTESQAEAISRTTGFVSSARFGKLERSMISGVEYLFPIGSALNYRPVRISPSAPAISGARYAEADASAEGLQRTFTDSAICQTNPGFYHLLSDVPAGTLVKVVIETAFAENWDGISSRVTADPAVWQPAIPVSEEISDSIYYSYMFTETGNRAFLLYRSRPAAPVISGETEVCALAAGVSYSAVSTPGAELIWNVAGGLPVAFNANEALVNWGSGPTGIITVVATDSGGCSSLPSSLAVAVASAPNADFIIHPPPFPFEDQLFTFESAATNVSEYFWNIGGNLFLNGPEISYAFPEPGTYEVTHIVINDQLCRDTVSKEVEIIEGIMIPDVFTPNGDGVNDQLEFLSSGIDNLSLSIFDRWGNTVFSSDKPKLNWDGRTSSGKLVPPGTYYYLLIAASPSMPYDKRGFITIIY